MQIINNRKKEILSHGNAILDENGKLYLLILEEGERYPYHLVCLETYKVLQSFDTIPSNEEIEEEVESTIAEIITDDTITIVLEEQ